MSLSHGGFTACAGAPAPATPGCSVTYTTINTQVSPARTHVHAPAMRLTVLLLLLGLWTVCALGREVEATAAASTGNRLTKREARIKAVLDDAVAKILANATKGPAVPAGLNS